MRRPQLLLALLPLLPPGSARAAESPQNSAILRAALHWDASWGPHQRTCRAYRDGETATITDITLGGEGYLIIPTLACEIRTRLTRGGRRPIMLSPIRPDWSTSGEIGKLEGSAEPGAEVAVLTYSVRLPSLRDYNCRPAHELDRESLAASAVNNARRYLGPKSHYHLARVWIPRFCDLDPLVFVLVRFAPGDDGVITLFARKRSGGWGGSTLSNSPDLAERIERKTEEVLTVSEDKGS
jgi:hypothetical protein